MKQKNGRYWRACNGIRGIESGMERKTQIAALTGLLASGIGILSVALTFVPQAHRSDYFWYRVVWAEVLVALIWGYIGTFVLSTFSKKWKAKGMGGVFPSLGIVITLYAAASLALMVVNAWISMGKFHLLVQVLLASFTVIIGVFLCLATVGQMTGMNTSPGNTTSSEKTKDVNHP